MHGAFVVFGSEGSGDGVSCLETGSGIDFIGVIAEDR